jgi:transmembrane sensor
LEKERYSDFKAPDFLLDDDFVSWIQGHDPASDADWQQWLNENPAGRREVDKARMMWQAMSFRNRSVGIDSLDRAWQNVKDKTSQSAPTVFPESENSAGRRFPTWVWMAAASILLLLGLWVGKEYYPRNSTPQLSQTQTVNGQQVTVTLIDGTTVRLNAGSTLRYPEIFPADKREVQLNGEAYFEVAPNAEAPFLISTGDVDVQVIGTKFTVKAYPESELVKVAVVEGKVAVKPTQEEDAPDGSQVYLLKDEMATVEKSNRNLSVTGYDKNELLGWQNGILYFEKANFTQIMYQLERWYGVEIRVDENVEVDTAWRFSGKFEKKSIQHILDVCRYPNLFSYQVSGDQVIVTKH